MKQLKSQLQIYIVRIYKFNYVVPVGDGTFT